VIKRNDDDPDAEKIVERILGGKSVHFKVRNRYEIKRLSILEVPPNNGGEHLPPTRRLLSLKRASNIDSAFNELLAQIVIADIGDRVVLIVNKEAKET